MTTLYRYQLSAEGDLQIVTLLSLPVLSETDNYYVTPHRRIAKWLNTWHITPGLAKEYFLSVLEKDKETKRRELHQTHRLLETLTLTAEALPSYTLSREPLTEGYTPSLETALGEELSLRLKVELLEKERDELRSAVIGRPLSEDETLTHADFVEMANNSYSQYVEVQGQAQGYKKWYEDAEEKRKETGHGSFGYPFRKNAV